MSAPDSGAGVSGMPPRGSASVGRWPLLAVVAVGALLRVLYNLDRTFVGDDAGTLHYLDYDYAYLLSHFDIWLTMNYFMVGLKALRDVFGDSPWVLVAPCLVAGLVAIPLVHRLALRYLDERFALAAAFLAAVNPWMIEFSVALRSYTPLVCTALAALLAYFRWADAPHWRRGVICAAWAGFAMILHPNAFYPLGFLGVLFLMGLKQRRPVATLIVPMAVAAVIVVLAYLPLREGMASYRADWTVAPPSEWGYLPMLARRYFGPGWGSVPALVLLALGFLWAVRERRQVALLGLGIVVPMCMASLLGVSTILGAWPRFLGAILPFALILVVQGMAVIAPRSRVGLALLVGLVLASWSPLLVRKVRVKESRPYHEIAAHLAELDPGPCEVFSFDVATRRFLVPSLGKDSFGSLSRWLRRAPERPQSRLIVLVPQRPLEIRTETRTEARLFGEIQVLTYTGADTTLVLEAFLADLERALDGNPIEPQLVDHYGALMSALLALGRDDEVVPYLVYYYECLLRTQRLHDVPAQILESRDTISKHPLIRELLD